MSKPKLKRRSFKIEERLDSKLGAAIKLLLYIKREYKFMCSSMETAMGFYHNNVGNVIPSFDRDIIKIHDVKDPYLDAIMNKRMLWINVDDDTLYTVDNIIEVSELTEDTIGITPLPALINKYLCPICVTRLDISTRSKLVTKVVNHEYIHNVVNMAILFKNMKRFGLTKHSVNIILNNTSVSELLAYAFESYNIDILLQENSKRELRIIFKRRVKSFNKKVKNRIINTTIDLF